MLALSTFALLGLASLLGAFTPTDARATIISRRARALHNNVRYYEVWVLDQSDTGKATVGNTTQTYGGFLYVYDGLTLENAVGNATKTPKLATVDLSKETADLCFEKTEAYPVRPHMILFNSQNTHASVSFVASGHVVIFDVKTRKPLSCLRTSVGFSGFRQAHSAYPTDNNKYIIVTNQNGKKLERIRTDYKKGTFEFEPAATIDLTNCSVFTGRPCEDPTIRPDNAPICAFPAKAFGKGAFFVTLRGGGLFAVDTYATPMRITHEYDVATIAGNGCGGVDVNGRVFVVSGAGVKPPFNFDVYFLRPSGKKPTKKQINFPTPKVLLDLTAPDHDGHGAATAFGDSHVWVYDRIQNNAQIFQSGSGKHVNTISLNGTLSSDPAPDLVASSPKGEFSFVSLRGPKPMSGGHSAIGNTPGVGVIKHTKKGRDGFLQAVIPLTNRVLNATEEIADPHGIGAVYFRK